MTELLQEAHHSKRTNSPDRILAPLVFRTQLDAMSTSRNWQNDANWCGKKIYPTSWWEASKYQLSKPIDKHGCIINEASSLPGATQMAQAFSRKSFLWSSEQNNDSVCLKWKQMTVASSREAGNKQLLCRGRHRGTTCWRQAGRQWASEYWLLNNSG